MMLDNGSKEKRGKGDLKLKKKVKIIFVCGGSLTSGQLIGALSRLPQGKLTVKLFSYWCFALLQKPRAKPRHGPGDSRSYLLLLKSF